MNLGLQQVYGGVKRLPKQSFIGSQLNVEPVQPTPVEMVPPQLH